MKNKYILKIDKRGAHWGYKVSKCNAFYDNDCLSESKVVTSKIGNIVGWRELDLNNIKNNQ